MYTKVAVLSQGPRLQRKRRKGAGGGSISSREQFNNIFSVPEKLLTSIISRFLFSLSSFHRAVPFFVHNFHSPVIYRSYPSHLIRELNGKNGYCNLGGRVYYTIFYIFVVVVVILVREMSILMKSKVYDRLLRPDHLLSYSTQFLAL